MDKNKESSIADYWQLVYKTHVSEGVAAVKDSTKAERAAIIRRFKEVKAGARERLDGYNQMAARSRS
jgi:hypothetical protein